MPESSKVSIALHGLGLKRNFLHDCYLEYDPSIHLQHDKHCVHHAIFPKLDYDWQVLIANGCYLVSSLILRGLYVVRPLLENIL